jgi:hypothetical protein
MAPPKLGARPTTTSTRQRDRHGARPASNTRPRSWQSTTPIRAGRRHETRSCAAKVFTALTSRNSASRLTPAPARAWPVSRRSDARPTRPKLSGSGGRTSGSRRSFERRRPRWRSPEKCTRSWSSSPRTRTPKTTRRGDRGAPHGARGGHLDEAGMRATRPQPAQVLPRIPSPRRIDSRRTRVLRRVLRSLQPRPPPRRHQAPHPSIAPLRNHHRNPRSTNRNAHRHQPPTPPKLPAVA